MTNDILKGMSPEEAYKAYLESHGVGITPLIIFQYVQDFLQTLPDTEAEMLNYPESDTMHVKLLLGMLSSKGWDEIKPESWGHMKGWATEARRKVAEVNKNYPHLSQIIGMAQTNYDNHYPPK